MSHDALLTRIRGEYLEMPGLRLTVDQAQRLCGVDRTPCQMALDALVEAGFLCVRPDGVYARLLGGDVARWRLPGDQAPERARVPAPMPRSPRGA